MTQDDSERAESRAARSDGTIDRIGLVLGGGAALGAAHIGVLSVLDELGIQVDVVVGTSAGALMGAGFAAGLSLDVLTDRVRSATWADFGEITVKPRLGLLDVTPLEAVIESMVGDRLIEELPITFGAVASDVARREPVLMTSGPLHSALTASIAVPGIFSPVRRDDRVLIDGTFTSNVPLWAARELGATKIISVVLRPTWNKTRVGQRIVERLGVVIDHEPPDIEIHPDVDGFSKWSANDIDDLIEAGRAAATDVLAARDGHHSFG